MSAARYHTCRICGETDLDAKRGSMHRVGKAMARRWVHFPCAVRRWDVSGALWRIAPKAASITAADMAALPLADQRIVESFFHPAPEEAAADDPS